MRIRTFITTGDEILLGVLCDRYGCKLEIGGPVDHDGFVNGFERRPGPDGRPRTDFMAAYIICEEQWQLLQIQAEFGYKVLNGA